MHKKDRAEIHSTRFFVFLCDGARSRANARLRSVRGMGVFCWGFLSTFVGFFRFCYFVFLERCGTAEIFPPPRALLYSENRPLSGAVNACTLRWCFGEVARGSSARGVERKMISRCCDFCRSTDSRSGRRAADNGVRVSAPASPNRYLSRRRMGKIDPAGHFCRFDLWALFVCGGECRFGAKREKFDFSCSACRQGDLFSAALFCILVFTFLFRASVPIRFAAIGSGRHAVIRRFFL